MVYSIEIFFHALTWYPNFNKNVASRSWSDIKFKDIVNKYKRDVVPPKLREEIREQMMIKYLMAKRKDQLSR